MNFLYKRANHYKPSVQLLILFGLIFLMGCQTLEKHEPVLNPVKGNIEHPISDVHLPLLLEIDEIEDLINTKLDGEIYNDPSFDKDNVKLSISKIGRISVSLQGNYLYYRLPLHIWIQARIKKKLLRAIKKQQTLDFSLVLHFRSKLEVDEQWKPVVTTKLLKYEWVKKPKVKIGFMKVGVKKLVEKQLDKRMDGLLENIDQSIHEKLDIKPLISKVWTDIQKPILINKKVTQVWLKAEPQKLFMTHINGKDGYLQLNVRLQAELHTLFGDTAGMVINKKLPPLLHHEDTSSHFSLYVKSSIPLELLTDLLNEQVGRKDFSVEGYEDYKVSLDKFQVLSSDSQLVLKVGIDGEINGDVYFNGSPMYDSASQVLTLQNFDLAVSSEEVLMNTAEWLLKSELKLRVQEELKLSIGDKLSKLPLLIQNAIDNSKLSQKASIRLSNVKLEPKEILITDKDVQLLLQASGNVNMELEKLQQ